MITLISSAVLAGAAVFYLARKVHRMSASLERLKSAVVAIAARVSALETQPVGTPDTDLDALSTQLEALVAPTVPAPPPAE